MLTHMPDNQRPYQMVLLVLLDSTSKTPSPIASDSRKGKTNVCYGLVSEVPPVTPNILCRRITPDILLVKGNPCVGECTRISNSLMDRLSVWPPYHHPSPLLYLFGSVI